MREVTIKVVEKPASFEGVKFTLQDWETASKKAPALTLPAASALENVKNSKGLYEIVPEKKEIEVNVGGMSLNEMSSMQLKLVAANLGVTMKRKNIKRSDLEALVTKKLEETIVIDEDEEV